MLESSRLEASAAGCGFLAPRELARWIEGGLGVPRTRAFAAHERGCADCALLAADLAVFRHVDARGLLASEVREFERSRALVRAELRREVADLAIPRRSFGSVIRDLLARREMALALAASLLVVALAVPWMLDSRSGGGLDVRGLSIPPPVFVAPPELRSAGTTADWRAVEAAWGAGDWSLAERRLGALATADGASHDAALYHGVALVLLGRPAEARPEIERALRLADEYGFPGLVDNFWLGVAAAAQGDEAAARAALAPVQAAGGGDAALAGALLDRLGRD